MAKAKMATGIKQLQNRTTATRLLTSGIRDTDPRFLLLESSFSSIVSAMNSLDTQLILKELRKLRQLFEQDAVRESSRCVSISTKSVVVGTDIVADNWGGLFDGGNGSDEQHCEARYVVADNWGGLFEQPAHIVEKPAATELQQHTRGRAPSSRNDVSSAIPGDVLDIALPTHLIRPVPEEFVSIAPDVGCVFSTVDSHSHTTDEDEIPNHLDCANSSATPSSASASDDMLALIYLNSGLSDPAGRLAPGPKDTDRACTWPRDSCDPRMGCVAAPPHPTNGNERGQAMPHDSLMENLPTASLARRLPHYARLCLDTPASLLACELLNLPPTRCSMQVHNSNFSSGLLHPSPVAPVSTLPTPAVLMTMAPFPASTAASIAGSNFSSNIIDNQDTGWVLGKVAHKQLWPPPVQCEIQGDVVQMVICVAWNSADQNALGDLSFQVQQPWPPPSVFPLQPLPWPSFSNYAASVLGELKFYGIQNWPFFCNYAVLVHLNTSELAVLHWMSFGCIQIVEGSLEWSLRIGTAALLFVTDDSSDHCTLLRQFDSAKALRNLRMHAPGCLIVHHIILVPWRFWAWFDRYTSDMFMQLIVPLSSCVWTCSSALKISSSILLGTLLASQSVTKEVQYSNICLSCISSLSHEPFGTSMLISLSAKGSTRDSMLAFGLDKSIIMWDPGAKPMSFLHRNSFDASKTCYSQALQTAWQLWNANCVCCNIRCTNLSSLMQHQHGFWLSACRVQVYPLQSLLVETYGNRCDIGAADGIIYDAISLDATQHWSAQPLLVVESKIFAVIYIDMKTRLEFNLTSAFMCAPLVFDMLPTSFQTCYVLLVYHQLYPWLTSAYRANSCFRHVAAEMNHHIGTYQLFEQAVGVQFRMMLAYVLLETRLSRGSFLRSSVVANSKLHDLSEQVIVHFLWDPGGANTLHRLGGTPILKEGGISVHVYGGAARWGQYMSPCPTHTSMIVTANSKAKARPYLASCCLFNAAFAFPSGTEKTATVGGGYVASEFAGDFNGLHNDVQVFKIRLHRPTRADYSAESVFSQLSIGLFGLTKDEIPGQEFQQFPWDPSGSVLLHRLGGKPILKEGGMLGDPLGLGRHRGYMGLAPAQARLDGDYKWPRPRWQQASNNYRTEPQLPGC